MDAAEVLSIIVERACAYVPEVSVGARNVKRVDWYYRPELAINNFPESISFDCDIRFIGSMSKRRFSFLSALI